MPSPEYELREFHLTLDGERGKCLPVRCVGSFCRRDGSVQIEEVWVDGMLARAGGVIRPSEDSFDIIDNLKPRVLAMLAEQAEEQVEGELTR